MITVQKEAWRRCGREILPMWKSIHADETVAPEDRMLVVNPQVEAYARLEASRILTVFTVRDEGLLIGYALVCFLPDFSCKHLLMANVMIHFILPEYRRSGTGGKLFLAIEAEAKKRGADAVLAGNKAHLTHGAFFEHQAYHPYGTTYIKWMDDDACTHTGQTQAQSLQET